MIKSGESVALILKSLQLDMRFLSIKNLSIADRISFLGQKYLILLGFIFRRRRQLRLRNIRFNAHTLSSLGTLQSSIVDFYADIVCTAIIQKKNPTIIDVGANVGQYCLAAKLFYPNARLYSFEPDPAIYGELQDNTRHLSGIHLFNFGVGAKEEEREFYIHPLSLMSSFKKYGSTDYDESHIKRIQVKVLDEVLASLQKIDLIKVDVEGFEQQVIDGAKKLLARSDFLLIELSLDRAVAKGSNLSLLSSVHAAAPSAKIIKFSRPLGEETRPLCQDSLISLRG